MDIVGIETFLSVIQNRTLTQASVQMHVSQSTVSKRLRILEEQLGIKLIIRNKGVSQIELTEKGEGFIPIAEQWMRIWRETQQLSSGSEPDFLQIGAVDSISNYVLIPAYKALYEASPPIHFQVRIQRSIELYNLVDMKEIDVGFAFLQIHRPNVKVEPYFSEPMVVIRLSQPGLKNGTVVDPLSLDPAYELYYDHGPVYQLWHDRFWDLRRRPRASFHTCLSILNMLYDRRQWSIMPLSFARSANVTGDYLINILDDTYVRTCFKLTHQYPRRSAEKSLQLFEQYVTQFRPILE
ncbi:hypothetical protein AXX12_15440 [Anaerosporomusa subterranea]|uniref:HTH lysR-type domain-containing protein n=1 Tax=Anaerosporomusa subterranea TaxID=1794912 RepID=A0A154BM46_ANASB|nr:LysR family transcriptional regulator [Anaerosporomusa subterranea]KYZ74971.1 hypothetical protein AXX12_15440 [Anaerosporomusa subterranea]